MMIPSTWSGIRWSTTGPFLGNFWETNLVPMGGTLHSTRWLVKSPRQYRCKLEKRLAIHIFSPRASLLAVKEVLPWEIPTWSWQVIGNKSKICWCMCWMFVAGKGMTLCYLIYKGPFFYFKFWILISGNGVTLYYTDPQTERTPGVDDRLVMLIMKKINYKQLGKVISAFRWYNGADMGHRKKRPEMTNFFYSI